MPANGLRFKICIVAVLGSAATLLPAAAAGAKFTCEERGSQPGRLTLRGLPDSPVARRTYSLTLTSLSAHGTNPSPYLGTAYCDRGRVPEPWPNGDFSRVADAGRGVFMFELRFPRAGQWAVSIMDLEGTFRDFGLRRVRAAGSKEEVAPQKVEAPRAERTRAPSADRSRGLPPLALGAGIVSLGLTAGLALRLQRRRRGLR